MRLMRFGLAHHSASNSWMPGYSETGQAAAFLWKLPICFDISPPADREHWVVREDLPKSGQLPDGADSGKSNIESVSR
jgi:hypothetical protein